MTPKNIQQQAESLHTQAAQAKTAGNLVQARDHYLASLALRRQIGDPWQIARALTGLGNTAYAARDYTAAREYYQESMQLKQSIGRLDGVAGSLNNLGLVAMATEDLIEARDCFTAALRIANDCRPQTTDLHAALFLQGYAELLAREGDAERAATFWGAIDRCRESAGETLNAADEEDRLREQEQLKTSLDEERWRTNYAQGTQLTISEAIRLALEPDRSNDAV